MSDVKMTLYRVINVCCLVHPFVSKPVAHYVDKEEAVKVAQSLQLHAGKWTRYHVDSVEVY